MELAFQPWLWVFIPDSGSAESGIPLSPDGCQICIATIWAWQVFDLTYTMTKGGPARSTLSTGLLIYNTAFIDNQVGRASAQSWVLLIVILTLTGLYFLGQKKWVYYEND